MMMTLCTDCSCRLDTRWQRGDAAEWHYQYSNPAADLKTLEAYDPPD